MAEPISFGELDFRIVSSMEGTQGAHVPETPFRIAVLGDFSGRSNRSIIDPVSANRKPLSVDRDNPDEALRELKVVIRLPLPGKESPPVAVEISGLDDFHPDSLFERLEVFEALRETRRAIKDPSTCASLAKALKPSTPPPATGKDSGKTPEHISTGGLLDQVIEETRKSAPETESSRDASGWDEFLRQIVQPHLVPDIEPQLAEMQDAIDAAAGELMRKILHHPDFQAVESAWRSVHFLVSRLETDEKLRLYLIDISKDELAADLAAAGDLRSTGLYKLLAEQTVETSGGEPWAVLAGNYTFDNSRKDAELLGRIAKIAKAAGAPFISSAGHKLSGCEPPVGTPDPGDRQQAAGTEESKAWEALRKLPEASYLGLAMPGFLLRLPYGEETDPAERFVFEEMPGRPVHDYYLWGNPSFACAYLLGETFSRYGWNFQPGAFLDIENLPLHLYREDGESRIKPCAEVVFTERAVETILEKGIMPLLSYKNQDKIRLARFQSLAEPPASLAGRWG